MEKLVPIESLDAPPLREDGSPSAARTAPLGGGAGWAACLRRSWVELLCVALLLILLSSRIWGLGIVAHDDADWALQAVTKGSQTVDRWAVAQGRVWAYVAGPPMLHVLRHEGSFYADLLKVGSFVLFFAAFHLVLAAYFGRRLAILAATLFLGLMAIRWDNSILTAYPVFTWLLGAFFLGSTMTARTYVRGGGWPWLAATGACFFFSLFTNEGVTALCVVAFPVFLAALDWPSNWRFAALWSRLRSGRTAHLLWLWFGLAAAYAVLNLVWRAQHPSSYAGNQLAAFNLGAILRVAWGFSTNGSVLNDIFAPYVVNYVDALSGGATKVAYKPGAYFGSALTSPLAWVSGVAVAIAVYRVLVGPRSSPTAAPSAETTRPLWILALLLGLAVMLVPLLPVAASVSHQGNFLKLGIRSYPNSVLSHFGVSLILATLLLALFSVIGRARSTAVAGPRLAAIALAVAAGLGLLAAASSRLQDAIVRDIRPEAVRWAVMQRALDILPEAAPNATSVWAPRYASGTWFARLDGGYWSQYAKARYDRALTWSVTGGLSSETAASGRWAYLDYLIGPNDRDPVILLAPLATSANGKLAARDVAVLTTGLTPSDRASLFLTYRDAGDAPKQVRLVDLTPDPSRPDLLVLRGADADPASLRISPTSGVTFVDTTCGPTIAANLKIRFGTEGGPSRGCLGKAYLGEGWSSLEPTAVWSDAPTAVLELKGENWPAGDLLLDFDVQGFPVLTGRGSQQTVQVQVNGRDVASWTFLPAKAGAANTVRVPASVRGADDRLTITLKIGPTFNLRTMGLSADPRDLGVSLRSLQVRSAG